MTCTIPNEDRLEKMQELVLTYFRKLAGHAVSLQTTLGQGGLNHGADKRKLYRDDLRDALSTNYSTCKMLTLTPEKFGQTAEFATIGTIAAMVAKDLG